MSNADIEKAIEASKATYKQEQKKQEALKEAIYASKKSSEEKHDCLDVKHDCLDVKTTPALVAAEGYEITSEDVITAHTHEAAYASKSPKERKVIDDDYALALSLVGKA